MPARSFPLASLPDAVAPALDEIEAWLREEGVVDPIASELRLVAEELLTNVAKYAFDDAAIHQVEVRGAVDVDRVEMSVCDDGRPFDPLSHPAPDLFAPPEERPIGGLGLVMVKALCDSVAYRREGDRNIVTVAKRRSGGETR